MADPGHSAGAPGTQDASAVSAVNSRHTLITTSDPLEKYPLFDSVADEQYGAVSTFYGTTRNSFCGKPVIKLEYEAYCPMVIREFEKICAELHAQWDLGKITIVHRIGIVMPKEISVAIAVSSVHRRESLQAVALAIDLVKARAPIWKKEWYVAESGATEMVKDGPGHHCDRHAPAHHEHATCANAIGHQAVSRTDADEQPPLAFAWKQNAEFDKTALAGKTAPLDKT